MFRRVAVRTIRKYTSETGRAYQNAGSQFATGSTYKKTRRWIPWSIFGSSFLLGWVATQHMTFTDFMAYWRYETLPESAPEVVEYKNKLLQRLDNLSVVKQLKGAGYVEVLPSQKSSGQLIDQTLNSPGAIAIPPRFYFNPKTKETVGIYHLGMKLTGYPFIVHGGILATVLEDLMRESVKFNKDKNSEKTKDISISYRMPTFANQFVVVRTTKLETFGKNIKLQADIMDQSGMRLLVKGTGSFSI
ncbi:Fmp10p KNAG_0M00160 [Huiozyma naganishii CBS 8797]|uniref:Thioesterase domain-containing protein n=1 Tax=Huiozyma naganishii (strain ATCC MYA-139 / BCRC 22969 / CBS 8797 / KCTC 17520 / NBRC 10181 / NCYC 3082 / Yp74L-3) TaxID=1071383 RepID=J7SAM3_HUIN7|nr:hypothetical protein KNAG_0M00160 [Kazachstania naganishii CBS 8797]CCK72869.1 hypothetical protein KNAG_0M00160 [Kazachstania naganishii CBS 8797]